MAGSGYLYARTGTAGAVGTCCPYEDCDVELRNVKHTHPTPKKQKLAPKITNYFPSASLTSDASAATTDDNNVIDLTSGNDDDNVVDLASGDDGGYDDEPLV
jgi:hypothetical protein